MHLAELTAPEVAGLPRNIPVILPVAALEQHGPHLPVFTDSLLLGEIVRRAHDKMGSEFLLAPLLWLGNSDHHLDFGGTLSAEPRAYIELLDRLVENLLDQGFRRIVFLNGHGGNDVPGRQALFEVRQRHRKDAGLLLLFATYWQLGAQPWEKDATLIQRQMGHACEWETSMILRIAGHLVKGHHRLPPVDFGNSFLPASRAWIMKDRSPAGYIGNPAAAQSEKGEKLFESFSESVVSLIERVVRWDGASWEG